MEPMNRDEILADVQSLVRENRVVLFMKGTPDQPMCGFSTAAADVLKLLGHPFTIKNVLDHPEYRFVLAEHSNWSTIPQLFVDGQFLGGCDIIHELFKSGDLKKKLDQVDSA